MQSEQHYSVPPSIDGKRFQWLPSVNSAPTKDDDEGGLNLGQVFAALRRKLPIIAGVTVVVTSAAMLKAINSTPIYQSGFEILTKPVTVEGQVISSVPQTLSNREQQPPSGQVDQTTLKVLKSPKILSPIVDELKVKYPDITYDELLVNLVLTPVPSSEILTVTYQSKNPEKVKAVLTQVSEAYLAYSLEERLADVRQGIEFVDAQLPQLQKRVNGIQDQLQAFRQKYNLIDPESTSKQLADQTNSVGQQRLETQLKLNEARALYLDLTRQLAQLSNESAASSALTESSRYQSLLNQILSVESEIAKESTLYRENTPNVQILRDQKENLLPLLSREGQRAQQQVSSRIRELETRNAILAQSEAMLNQQVKQLSVVSRQYADIQQDLKIATENLNQFLTKREALRIDAGQRKTPWQILTAPSAPFPSAANVKRTTMLGAIFGLLLGVGVALLLDKLSSVFHSPEDIKDASKLPILGVIPYNPDLEEVHQLSMVEKVTSIADIVGFMQQMRQKFSFSGGSQSGQYTTSPFLEAFRSLYTNIRLLSSDTQIRSLAISSSSPGEGKSTISVHLALAAAALGQKVLLVDTDLRLPQLHNRLGLTNSYGLSNLIASDLEFERLIQQSPIENNLFVLTAGQVPPDPTKLLSSQKMQNLMEQFKQTFDLVLYDMPPLLGLADAKLIASKADGIAMVVALGKTKSASLTQALESIKLFQVTILGIVANGSRDQVMPFPESYHRYYAAESVEPALDREAAPLGVKPFDD